MTMVVGHHGHSRGATTRQPTEHSLTDSLGCEHGEFGHEGEVVGWEEGRREGRVLAAHTHTHAHTQTNRHTRHICRPLKSIYISCSYLSLRQQSDRPRTLCEIRCLQRTKRQTDLDSVRAVSLDGRTCVKEKSVFARVSQFDSTAQHMHSLTHQSVSCSGWFNESPPPTHQPWHPVRHQCD